MKLNWNKRKKSEAASKIFRSGVYSAAVTALVLVLVILLNLIVRAIPSRYTEWDLSEAGLYTLSDNSIEVVKNLTQDVKIYYLAETGNEDVILSKLLDHYAAESSHLSWELKDPALYPTFATQYGATDVTNGSLILVCGENSTVLDAADLYEEDYSNYSLTGTSSVTFDGENKITSAIYRLTSGEEHHAYYTTNHGEQTLTDTLTSALENQNLTLTGLDMLSDSIPEDCDLLVINNPVQDFASAGALVDEMSDLRGYLEPGRQTADHHGQLQPHPQSGCPAGRVWPFPHGGSGGGGGQQSFYERLPHLFAAGLRLCGGERRAGQRGQKPRCPASDGPGHRPDRDRRRDLGSPADPPPLRPTARRRAMR